MKRRTTENESHKFQNYLFEEINAYNLQGLLLDGDRKRFTAGVEYFELTEEEYEIIKGDHSKIYSGELEGMLLKKHVYAQSMLTKRLEIPLYYIFGYQDNFVVHCISNKKEKELKYCSKTYKIEELISFWRQLKQTVQTHSTIYNGASDRAKLTRIDDILKSEGLEWGGNIDGFIIDREKNKGEIVAVFDCISIGEASQTTTHDLTDPKANPANYFHKKGPKYETYLSIIRLGQALGVPYLLMTLNSIDRETETVGLVTIEKLTKENIFFAGGIGPNENVITGINNIKESIVDSISQGGIPIVLSEES